MKTITKIKSYFRDKYYAIKYFFEKFEYLRVFWSPFIRPRLRLYCGEVSIGTPFFYPRKWVKPNHKMALEASEREIQRFKEHNERNPHYPIRVPSLEELLKNKKRCLFPVPKKFGFDFVGLGWKTKWSDKDIRVEHAPLISFVFFKWQIALTFDVPEYYHYWSAWIYYSKYTKTSDNTEQRLKESITEFPLIWTQYIEETKQKVNYWNSVLKPEYLYLVPELTPIVEEDDDEL
jgi:hypothetical protein